MVGRVENEDLENDEDANDNQAERTNLGENHLQVAGRVIVLPDQRRSASKESVGSCRDDDAFGFTLLAS